MKLILSHSSALDFLRANRWRRGPLAPARIRSLADCASSLRDVRNIPIPAFEQSEPRLEVLVGLEGKGLYSNEHVCRYLKAPLAAGMFNKIDDNVFTTSPEMTFVQMAKRLSPTDLMLLGMEFCGTYAFSPYGDYFDDRPPLTSKVKLVSFCKRASEVRGSTHALKTLRWIADGSNSPAETALMLYLCLPVRMGGYGFALPDMNPTTNLGLQATRMFGYGSMRCDLHWVDKHVAIEYDSDEGHLSSQSASKDARRRNVMGYEGVTVITVRKPMIDSPVAFDDVARQLAKALGRRLYPRDLEFTHKRSCLRFSLFPWLRRGRIEY